MMQIVDDTSGADGIDETCLALGVCRATYYRSRQPRMYGPRHQVRSPRSLLPEETSEVLALLHEDRFVDLAPAQVYATLLDEGRFVCSERTMYRVLTANREVRERRASVGIRSTPRPSCSPRRPTSCGRGTSPSSRARRPGRTSTCT